MTVDEVTKNNQEEGRRRSRRRSRQAATKAPEAPVKQQVVRKDKPTPARRDESKGNFITRPLRRIANYFAATRAELQKVTWPTREESLRLSGIVIAVTAVFSLALGGLDLLFGELFRLGFNTPVIFMIFAVVLVVVIVSVRVVLRRRNGL